ncbi:MAG: RHS repeat-associated core domain-containing protein [Bacillota bacterium]
MTHGPLNGTMADFTFDARDRLTAAGGLSYTYDAEGNRIGITEGGSQNSFVVDPNADLSQVLIKIDASGNQTYYVYGLGLIGQEENGAYRTYHYDLRGSTVALTDTTGAVTDRFQYSFYGELVYRTGSTSTPFLFNGRDGVMTDANGLLYMRARYFNPEIGRFVSRDPVTGSIVNPKSIDAHSYCENDPVNGVDPSGNFVQVVVAYAGAVAASPDTTMDTQLLAMDWAEGDYVAVVGDAVGAGIPAVSAAATRAGAKEAEAGIKVGGRWVSRKASKLWDVVKSKLPRQVHHYATNKHKVFTPQLERIAKKYGLNLDEEWNKELLPHLGRHPNQYHEFVLEGMRRADREARGDKAKFLKLYKKYVREPIQQNPELLRKSGW